LADARRALVRVTAALEQRRKESLRLFTPQPHQEAIFRSTARRLLIRGGNRSGKTLCGAVRIADWITGNKRFGIVRNPEHLKVLCVSLDFSLMSENIYRKLFEPGAFELCKECSHVRHMCSCEGDWVERAVPADPLIPSRFLDKRKARDGFAWLDKARGIPAKAWLRTGAQLDFKSTDQGRAKFQGIPWDVYWCDEEATNDEEIMNEIERGMIDRQGFGQITATPLAASLTMVNWSERAGEQKAEKELAIQSKEDVPQPFYEEIQLYTDDNLALERSAIERFYEGMSEEEEGVRRRGEFLVQQGLVYGREFDKKLHVVDTFPVPLEWTVYEIQDPGHAVAFATLYWAVSPEGDHYLFDELYLRRKDISDVVRRQKRLLSGASAALDYYRVPQRSLVDPAAAQVGAGMKGQSVLIQLHKEREKQNHWCYEGRHKCYKAHNEVQAGIFAVKALLKPREEGKEKGKPRLYVMRHLHHLLREARRYRWPRPQPGQDLVEKRGPIKKDDHLMDCLRYGALAKLQFVPPEMRPNWGANRKLRKTIARFQKERRQKRTKKRRQATSLSP
jgi:hypothetical protein